MKFDFFNKAKNNLNAAQLCFDNALYDASANRAYYAAFQAAIAVLLHKGIKRDKIDHKLVQADFSEKLIKRQKIFPNRLKSYLLEMQSVRDQADYKHENVSKQEAFRQIRKAEEMLNLIEQELKK
ncbi:MAG: HEPN domain-containing protein [Desulfobacterales bacterium]|nr:HEPN domain-containing protein [Desulfobacterales bacterium]